MPSKPGEAMSRDNNQSRRATPSLEKPQKQYRVCKYFNTPRGCYSQTSCRFLHGEHSKEPPYEQQKLCRYYENGFCRHGDACWFRHEDPVSSDSDRTASCSDSSPSSEGQTTDNAQNTSEADNPEHDEGICGICMEIPTQYGLLSGCSHAFCLDCLRNWRSTTGKADDLLFSNVIKACPLCRVVSKFITPSSKFFANGDPKKEEMINAYKASMAKITCKYIANDKSNKFCPYGSDCFYRHVDAEGHVYRFDHGVDVYMQAHKARRYDIPRRRIRLQGPMGMHMGEEQLVAHFIDTAFRSHPTDMMSIFAEFLRNTTRDLDGHTEDEHNDNTDPPTNASRPTPEDITTHLAHVQLQDALPYDDLEGEPEAITRQHIHAPSRGAHDMPPAFRNMLRLGPSSSHSRPSTSNRHEQAFGRPIAEHNHPFPALPEAAEAADTHQEERPTQNSLGPRRECPDSRAQEQRSPLVRTSEALTSLPVPKEDELRPQGANSSNSAGPDFSTLLPSLSEVRANMSAGPSRSTSQDEDDAALPLRYNDNPSLLPPPRSPLQYVTTSPEEGESSCSLM